MDEAPADSWDQPTSINTSSEQFNNLIGLVDEMHASGKISAREVELREAKLESILSYYADGDKLTDKQQIMYRARSFIDGIIWMMEHLQGRCIDYGYFYRYRQSPYPAQLKGVQTLITPPPEPATLVINDAGNGVASYKRPGGTVLPMNPLQFCLAMLGEIEQMTPEHFRDLARPRSGVSDLVSVTRSPACWMEGTAPKRMAQAIDTVMKQLSFVFKRKYERLMSFHPTLLFYPASNRVKQVEETKPTEVL
eukprot:TRINITY_DN16248_c0_g1_i2.p1 TRINITY_DN16248_c0_g1~~TRINITY_DN16248_c0_g1_i2.p1  ORF type:complete len:261 (+),score=50.63 TRINITY_DN16248_c0_g1_i2:32-784(+)